MSRKFPAFSLFECFREPLCTTNEVLLRRRASERDADKAWENMSRDRKGGEWVGGGRARNPETLISLKLSQVLHDYSRRFKFVRTESGRSSTGFTDQQPVVSRVLRSYRIKYAFRRALPPFSSSHPPSPAKVTSENYSRARASDRSWRRAFGGHK